jgi:GR25 family glycosyltransferase involved in LPS biosynthesis
VERKKMITNEWIDKRKFNIEFFDAFDRREVEQGKLIFPYSEKIAIDRIGRPLSTGEIACATSHCLLLRKALEEGQNEIILMEDDCAPMPDTSIVSVFNSIEKCKRNFPKVKVLLMHDADKNVKILEQKEGINLLSFPQFGCRFVWLDKKAMEILANDLSTMCYPADWLWAKRFVPMRVLANLVNPVGIHYDESTYIGNTLRGYTERRFIQ